MKQRLKSERGITLVALVVTIVVLLILAGITIMYTMGENSIFKKAQDAKDKTAEAVKNEQEYMNSIDNMVNGYINGTGNGGGSTPTGPVVDNSSTGEHTETTVEYTREQIDKIAQAIANSSDVTSETTEVTANIDGTNLKLGVGDIATVEYSGTSVRVRVLGFKHDDLVNTGAYGGNHTKASISFEFLDFMTGTTYKYMNSSNTNSGGWANTQMRKDLNGYSTNAAAQSGAIGGLGANLSNKSYIKQVKKKYIATYNNASSVTTCNDYLWLLAASEVVNNGYNGSGTYGYAITSEGSQYKYYQGVTDAWNSTSTGRQKRPSASGSTVGWWLRSPGYNFSSSFCGVDSSGYTIGNSYASGTGGVVPGFSI